MKKIRNLLCALVLCLLACMTLSLETKAYHLNEWREFGDNFSWTDGKGVTWYCVEYGANEAGVYGCGNAPMEIEIPAYVYEDGVGKKVTCVVSKAEALGSFWYEAIFVYHGKLDGYMLYKIVFPDTVNYIGSEAFSVMDTGNKTHDDMLGLAFVTLPQNPTLEIGSYAFRGCNLMTVTFKATVGSMQPVKIGEEAFAYCNKLENITFPPTGDRNDIDASVLRGCSKLKKIVNAPEKIVMEGIREDGTVYPNNSLKEVYFAEGITWIGGASGASALTTVKLPSTAKSVGGFSNLTSLTTINLTNGLTTIREDAFRGCSSLTGFSSLPASVTEIGDRAFMGCKNLHLENVRINQESVGYAFKDSGLVSITLGSGVYSVWGGSFTGCENLKEINVDAGNTGFFSKDGVLYTGVYKSGTRVGDSLFIYPAAKSYAGSYTIPENAFGVGGFAFDGCKFTEIHIPATVRVLFEDMIASLGDRDTYYAFDNMKNSSCVIYLIEESFVDCYHNLGLCSFGGHPYKYEKGSPVSVKYVLNGGTNNAANPKTFYGGDKILLKEPTRKGYTFLGWKVGDYTGYRTSYTPSEEELLDGVTFTAEWKKEEPKPTSTAVGQVGTLRLTNAKTTSMKVTYSKISGATGYHILVSTDKNFKTGKKSFYTKATSKTLSGLKSGKTYYVKVRAYKKNSSGTTYGKYSKSAKLATISVGTVKNITARKSASNKISVTLSAVKNAKGYQVTVATDKKFTKNKKTVNFKKRSGSVTKLIKGKTYYVRARAYKLNAQKQKVYGAYSKAVKVKL